MLIYPKKSQTHDKHLFQTREAHYLHRTKCDPNCSQSSYLLFMLEVLEGKGGQEGQKNLQR